MSANIEQLHDEWLRLLEQSVEDEESPPFEKSAADLLTRTRALGSHVSDLRARGDLQDLAREVANHVFKKTGEFPSAAIAPLSWSVPDFRADISRIIKYAPAELIGRENDLKLLNEAWDKAVRSEKGRPHILTFVAQGGEGKTSLVAKWAAELAHQDWPGCEAAFAWSFYSQGTSEKTQASSDSFLKEALLFFGDSEMANSAAGSFDKGRRLAQLIRERRALLILDGLEPLQYAPTSPTGSELKDQGISALLKALATKNDGLCVVTTRYSIPDLRNFWQATAPEIKLTSLSREAGVALLRTLGMKGTQKEFEQLVNDVRGHALTLNLIGTYLRDAHGGDIRKRDLVKLEEADAEEQSGHAFRVMDVYVNSFKGEGEQGRRALSILRLLGLFDRPATVDCLNALWTGEEIGGLNGPLLGISEAQRNITLKRLEEAHLITVNRDSGSQQLASLDAHPFLREYFATRLRQELPDAWRAAHRRLYEYLRDSTEEGDEPTLEELQPLYQAVAHGCHASLQKEAYDQVYFQRILRGNENYSTRELGVFGSELGAISCFFERPWNRLATSLSEKVQARILNQSAYALRALGRLTEALEPMRAGKEMLIEQQNWRLAAISASNLSELELTFGDVSQAVADAEQAVTYADRSGDASLRRSMRHTHADALHQSGLRLDAETRFREAEQMQAESQPDYPLLFSLPGFRYCDLLLDLPTREAWLGIENPRHSDKRSELIRICEAVAARARQTLKGAEASAFLLDIALHHLTLGRAMLSRSLLGETEIRDADIESEKALDDLRRAGQQQELPRGLVTRAWVRFVKNNLDSSRADLDEAWEIAERGPMRLHMADIHLYRARLFHDVKPYPWTSPQEDLAAARKLIESCGYWRRKEELEDAEAAAKNW
jgi:DNA-binding transcriptional ArsR family regulator